jgi:hypothetical protein
MKLTISKKANINYLAKIVNINTFRPLVGADKLKCCTVDGFNIICGIDSEPGLYVYFPVGCCLNPDFLKYANLYKNKENNSNPEQSGMFENSGRVKIIKLRGELSEGFILPITILKNYILSVTNVELTYEEGIEFDIVEHLGKTFWINKKYIVPIKIKKEYIYNNKGSKQPKGLDKIIDGQFNFHYDTVLIKKCPQIIKPNDIISISEKIHGTSGISALVLCKQSLNWRQKIAKWLTGYEFNKYDYLYSSRTIIKNKYYNKNVSDGYYNVDVWKYADEIIKPYLQKGMSIYYEIVGFLPNGSYIQKNYDYRCVPPISETYLHEKHFKVRPYRITITNIDGKIHEFSAKEVQQYCLKMGLTPVREYYYGYAKDLYPDLDICSDDWSNQFINKLSEDKNFYMECNSPTCDNEVPHEGIVIKIENMISAAFKLKCFKFLNKSQNDESVDMEDI